MKNQFLMGRLCVALIVLVIFTGCNAPAPPDATVTVLPPPPTTAPPAADASTIDAPAATPAAPTAAPTAADTRSPTETAVSATPTPATLQMSLPAPESEWQAGSDIPATGQTTAVTLTVRLQAGPYLLVEQEAAVTADGQWQAALPVPQTVAGAARLVAVTASEMVTTPLTLLPAADASTTDAPALTMTQPFPEQFAAPGYPLFFAGRVANAEVPAVTISFLVDSCREVVAQQAFTLEDGTADWNGYLILPAELEAEIGCAQASVGTEGASTWRVVLRRLPLLPEPAAGEDPPVRLTLGNPASSFVAGTVVTLFGAAINAPDSEVALTLLGTDGETVLAQGTAATDAFGQWEWSATLPAAAGESQLVIRHGEGETAVERRFSLQIVESGE